MSRIPKIAKGNTTDDLPPLPNIPKYNLKLRRSRSFSDLRTNIAEKSNKVILKTASFKRPAIKPSVLKNEASTSKAKESLYSRPTKRQNETKKENDPVQAKIAKIPSWDFKSRFNVLNEKYTKFQSDFVNIKQEKENMTQELFDLKLELKRIKESYEIEKKEKEILSQKYEKCKHMEEELGLTKEKYERIFKDHEYLQKQYSEIKEKYTNCAQNYDETLKLKNKLKEQVDLLQSEVETLQQSRKDQLNQILDLKGKIRVFCRLRPPSPDSEQLNFTFVSENAFEIIKGKTKSEFNFDKVFNYDAKQEEIFEEVSFLVQSALDGHNICIFAYGQTGSGKTYTMQGGFDNSNRGIIPRTVELLFKLIERYQVNNYIYKVQVSFMQIYNENVQDLLNLRDDKPLQIQFNEGKGITVQNLKTVDIGSLETFNNYFRKALSNRSVEATCYNETSSRSHAVTKIYLQGENLNSGVTMRGSISLVDLAGSERLVEVNEDRNRETKFINKSLSSLGTVMKSLYCRQKHIPYRNSKLTFLLQDSLGGNSKTLMIVNISPNVVSHGETINTLRFGAQVKEVKTNAIKNCEIGRAHV